MDSRVLEIRKNLKKKLDACRFEHTLGVSYTCQALAMRYDYDLDKAELAGLLHDCAKRFDGNTMREKCIRHNIEISESENRDPALLHAELGAWMAKEKYGVEDEEILNAIACHTTGKADMTLLDKILYVADYIEPRRYKADALPEMRKLAFIDLDLACFSIMENILQYLKSQKSYIDPLTEAACEDMRMVVNQKKNQSEQNQPEHSESIEKEDVKIESFKRNGTARSRSIGREKGRRRKNYRY